ncbi:MAG: MFS transporter [Dehalococcoidales bacterium]
MKQESGYGINRGVITLASLMAFAVWAPTLCVPPMEHILEEELLITHTQAGLLYTIPILMTVILGIPGGLLSDRIGMKKVAGIGIIMLAVGSMLRATATSGESIIAFTFLYGAGAGLCFPNLPKLVSSRVPRAKIGVATGIYTSVMITGMALAMAISVPLILPLTGSFRGVFIFWSVPIIVAAAVWWTGFRETDGGEALSNGKGRSVPLRRVLRNRNLWLVAIFFLLAIFFFDGWVTWAPSLMILKGATEDMAGLIVSLCMWAGIPTALFMPRFSYRLGLRRPFLWIPALTLALAAIGTMYTGISSSWILMVVIGVALTTIIPTILALTTEMVSREEVGTASGLVISVGNVGGIVGPLVGGRIYDLTGSLHQFLLVLIGVSAAATVVALRMPETGPGPAGKSE